MRSSIMVLLLLGGSLFAKTYYVAADGNDDNGDGTKNNPWLSWDKPVNILMPGDTLYIRGGKYTANNFDGAVKWWNFRFKGIHGTEDNFINIWNYPGETPIWTLDGAFINTSVSSTAILIDDCDYIHFRGLRISDVGQNPNESLIYGFDILNSTNLIIERCIADRLGGFGFTIANELWGRGTNTEVCNNILFLNCDAYANEDPYSTPNGPYQGSDGFNITHNSGERNNYAANITFRGCRSYFNSDDGWDFFGNDSGPVTIENSWAFFNGKSIKDSTLTGDGQGFKLGPNSISKVDYPQYTVKNCLAVGNRQHGFDQNTINYTSIHYLYNNISYGNGGTGFFFGYNKYHGVEESASVFKNNISFEDQIEYDFDSWHSHSHNSWNGSISLNASDFVSLDHSQLSAPRNADGSLPELTFAHLTGDSDLREAGTDVGLPFPGSYPDIGINNWEYESGGLEINIKSYFSKNGNAILIYPNPAKQLIKVKILDETISLKELYFRVIDPTGRVLLIQKIESFNSEIQNSLPTGYYFIDIGYKDCSLSTQQLLIRVS